MFIHLGDTLINTNHIVSVEFDPLQWASEYLKDEPSRQRPVLTINTTEMTVGDYGTTGRTHRYLDNDAVRIWEMLQETLPDQGKTEAAQRQADALEKIAAYLDFVIDDDSRTLSVRIPHAVSVGSMHP